MKMLNWVLVLTLAGTTTTALHAEQDQAVKAAKEVYDHYQGAVIWVSAVLKVEMAGRSQEKKMEAFGTIITKDGLTVVSYAMLDPISLYASFATAKQRKSLPKSQFSDVKMRLADGTEVPARLLLKDPDLDLGFLAPDPDAENAPKTFPHVTLDKTTKAQILDPLIVLTRLGKSFDEEACVDFTRVSAIVKKPRLFYVDRPHASGGGIGTPVFTTDGKVLGISLMRKGRKKRSLSSMLGGDFSTVILPCEDVLDIAQQAKKAASTQKAKT